MNDFAKVDGYVSMTGESINSKALILLTSRPESVEIAEMEIGPKVLGVTISQDILLGVAARCSELGYRRGGVPLPDGGRPDGDRGCLREVRTDAL